jgi:hypothetical protein
MQKILKINHPWLATTRMALNLAPSKHKFIYDMIRSGELSILELAEAAGYNKSTILRISSNIRMFSSIKALANKCGRLRSITPIILEALYNYLFEKPGLYLNEIAIFLWGDFNMYIIKSSISRALIYKG